MNAKTIFDRVVADLVGMEVSYVWCGYGSAIFIEIGRLAPRTNRDGSSGHPEGEFSLGVEWSWRIENGNNIICGSWSEEKLWEKSFDTLRGTSIENCKLFSNLPEIELTVSKDIRFLSFSTAEGQPQWHLVDRRKTRKDWLTVREGRLHIGDGTETPA